MKHIEKVSLVFEENSVDQRGPFRFKNSDLEMRIWKMNDSFQTLGAMDKVNKL